MREEIIVKQFLKFFVNGILVIVPIGLVVYVVVKVFQFLDGLLGNILRERLGDGLYVPGLGLLLTIILITLSGWLMTHWFSAQLLTVFERVLSRIPIVKTLYSIIKETIESFVGEKRSFSKVALVRLPHSELKVLGLVTTENLSVLGPQFAGQIAVYIPQTFQVAGFTVLVPEEHVEILAVKPEDAMRFIISGGVSGS